mmetsp:Transcript_39248/g.76161  ORF Transcript_39248/g.76161 Transcript_39248/m.76161 type:complete len:372 (+) Transcript_39248:77-1192(+)
MLGLSNIVRLAVRRQPPEIWYKDIGGKKDTFMSFVVALEGSVSNDLQWELHLDLFFEDRRRVEDKFQTILKTQHSPASPPIINSTNREVDFKFRIEKVSKNFMGQKFRVRCYARPLHPPGFEGVAKSVPNLTSPELNEVYSNPIESRSKRPSAGRSRSPGPRKRARQSREDNDDMERVITELQNTQEKLAQTQGALSKMVMVLQQCVTRLGAVEAATERSACHEVKEGNKDTAKPPALKRQQSKSRHVFRTEDGAGCFFNVIDDGTKIEDGKAGIMPIPPLLRQFSQEFASSKGDYPLLETGQGVLPPRIAPDDLNNFLDNLPGVPGIDRSLTPSFITQMSQQSPSNANGNVLTSSTVVKTEPMQSESKNG